MVEKSVVATVACACLCSELVGAASSCRVLCSAGRQAEPKQAGKQASESAQGMDGWWMDRGNPLGWWYNRVSLCDEACAYVCIPYANHSLLDTFRSTLLLPIFHLLSQSLDLLALSLPHTPHSITPHPRRVRLSLAWRWLTSTSTHADLGCQASPCAVHASRTTTQTLPASCSAFRSPKV